jgi:hypothetical protein
MPYGLIFVGALVACALCISVVNDEKQVTPPSQGNEIIQVP